MNTSFKRFASRLAELQVEGSIPVDLPPPETPEDGNASLLAIMPAYFTNPRHSDSHSLNGATFRPIVYERIFQALGNFDLRTAVSKLTMPTLSFISEVPFGPEMAGSLYEAIPNGNKRQVILHDCGHIPWVECPETFFSDVKAFLDPLVEDRHSDIKGYEQE